MNLGKINSTTNGSSTYNTDKQKQNSSATPATSKVKSTSEKFFYPPKPSTSIQPLTKSILDRNCTLTQPQYPPPPANFSELFALAKDQGFEKDTITLGYKKFNKSSFEYQYEPVSEKHLSRLIKKLSSSYAEYKDFTLDFAWQNACCFEGFAYHNPRLFTQSHDRIVEALALASTIKSNGFQPLQWIQQINGVLQTDSNHKVARLAGLWVDFSIIIAIDSNKKGLTDKNHQLLINKFQSNEDKFNWRQVPSPIPNPNEEPEIIPVQTIKNKVPDEHKTTKPSVIPVKCEENEAKKPFLNHQSRDLCNDTTDKPFNHDKYSQHQLKLILHKLTDEDFSSHNVNVCNLKANSTPHSQDAANKVNTVITPATRPSSPDIVSSSSSAFSQVNHTDHPTTMDQGRTIKRLQSENGKLLAVNARLKRRCVRLTDQKKNTLFCAKKKSSPCRKR